MKRFRGGLRAENPCVQLRFATIVIAIFLLLTATPAAFALPPFETLALSGTQAPGEPSGVLYADFFSSVNTSFGIPGPALGDNGQASFYGRLIGNGITPATTTGIGIWEGIPGNVLLLIQGGMTAPGAGAGSEFLFNPNGPPGTPPPIDAAGNAAVINSISPSLMYGLWVGQSNNVNLLALAGAQASGEPAGTLWNGFTSPLMTRSGEIAFGAGLGTSGQFVSSNVAIYSGTPGNLAQVAASGGPAPGTSTVFSSSGPAPSLTPTGVNNSGQVVFFGTVNSITPNGIWSGAPGQVGLLALAGAHPPGTSAGVTYGAQFLNGVPFTAPDINPAGQSVFAAAISGNPGAFQPAGIWAGTSTTLGLVAKTGDLAVGLSNGVT
jgi:hypothetical protein